MPFIKRPEPADKMPPSPAEVKILSLIKRHNEKSLFNITKREVHRMTPTISEGKVLDALYYLEQKRYILKSPMEAGVQIVLIKDFSEYEELYNEKQRLKRRRKRYKLSEGIGSVC